MKPNLFKLILILSFLVLSSQSKGQQIDSLSSWNETPVKASLITYIKKTAQAIPVEDRIAVFDMDGTIACETPLWFEMYAAINGLNQQWHTKDSLLNYPEYQYARLLAVNPFDTLITNYLVSRKYNFIDSMIWKAYAGVDNEVYIDSARAYLTRTKSKDPRFNMTLANMFYQPMIELIKLLRGNKFNVYVVSGSVRGVIWSVCPQTIELDRAYLIGTNQILEPVYNPAAKKTSFIIKKGIYQPKDDKDGKSENIYSQIGKVPVFAFGNTTGDFGMFRITSTSKYPHVCYLLNHDDLKREYAYNPWHGIPDPDWQRTMKENGWIQVDMSSNFKIVWKK